MAFWRASAKYSRSEQDQLERLKQAYRTKVSINPLIPLDPPASWNLLDGKPTSFVAKGRLEEFVNDLKQRQHANSKFFNQSKVITDLASSYLTIRRSRWFTSGSPGDILELAMIELMEFSTQQLPTLDNDPQAMEKIHARVDYIEELMNNRSIFPLARVQRDHNKMDTLRDIRQQLRTCEAIATREKQAISITALVQGCINDLSSLSMAFLNYVYYGRLQSVAQETFIAENFVKEGSYPKVKSTHTGLMLLDAINLAGLENLNVAVESKEVQEEKTNASLPNLKYYDNSFNPKQIDWNNSKISKDLPPWLSGDSTSYSYILDVQKALSKLKVAHLRSILIKANKAIAQLGEVWLYGKEPGKICFEALLQLIETDLNEFETQFSVLYEAQKDLRYATKASITDATNSNINKSTKERDSFKKFYDQLKTSIQGIRAILANCTEENINEALNSQLDFFTSLKNYVGRFSATMQSDFALKEKQIERIQQNTNFNLDKPLLEEEPEPQGWLATISKFWKKLFPEQGFEQWRKQFVERHKFEYQSLKKNMRAFENALNSSNVTEIGHSAGNVYNQLHNMKNRALLERPEWKISPLYIRLGWPFTRGTQKHIDTIIAELEQIGRDVVTQSHAAIAVLPKTGAVRSSMSNSAVPSFQFNSQRNPNQPLPSYRGNVTTLFQVNVGKGDLESKNQQQPLLQRKPSIKVI